MLSYCPPSRIEPVTDLIPDPGALAGPLEFPDGLPGFPHARRFQFEPLEENLPPFFSMRSLDIDRLRFVVVAPGAVFDNYVVEVPEDDVERLGLHDAEDALVVVIVTVSEPPTANLLGPVVVNRHTGLSRQVVLTGSGYDVQTPLPLGG
jgi:flagellar assembly factor FliW